MNKKRKKEIRERKKKVKEQSNEERRRDKENWQKRRKGEKGRDEQCACVVRVYACERK